MDEKKYVAYVGTYTHGSSVGIHLFDLDVENGTMSERKVIPINNPSYIKMSHNGRFLYSIADEGVRSFTVLPDGDLEPLNCAGIEGMRGCYLSTDKDDKYLFVAGWHDGKVTVMRLNEDGTVGKMTDEVFHKGLGSVAERNFRPHVNCVNLTPDGKYLCAVDLGTDQIKIYKFDPRTGKIALFDLLFCELESAPRIIKFSRDGRFAYVISELKNYISVYSYDGSVLLQYAIGKSSTSFLSANTVKRVAAGAFEGAKSLKEVTLSTSLTEIGEGAFRDCTALAKVGLPASLVTIGEEGFRGCTSLKEITIPASVQTIGVGAFQGCTELENAYFEETEGWSAGSIPLDAESLAKPSTAAVYLTDAYRAGEWTRG